MPGTSGAPVAGSSITTTTSSATACPTADALAGTCETFAHGADVGVRGRGPTLAAAFAQAALALTSVVVEPEGVASGLIVDVVVDGAGLEDLFYAWLDALIFQMATRRAVFSTFAVEIEVDDAVRDGPQPRARLRARLCGEPVDRVRHAPALEVKGPTWCGLSVARGTDGMWTAQCVVDV